MSDDPQNSLAVNQYDSQTTSPSGQIAVCMIVPARIAVRLDFIPIQFKKDNIPDSEDRFYALESGDFKKRYLLADASSKALIIASLILVDSNDNPIMEKGSTQLFYNNEGVTGDVVIYVKDIEYGTLTYKDQVDKDGIVIPFEDFIDGLSGKTKDDSNSIIFKTTRKTGETELIPLAMLTSHQDIYEAAACLNPANIPKKNQHKYWLKPGEKIGSRNLKLKDNGLDVAKLQWLLSKKFGFYFYKTKNVYAKKSESRWTNFELLGIDGDFGKRCRQALTDFQILSRGSYRNQNNRNVAITFTAEVNGEFNNEVADEVGVWLDKGYRAECHHGLVQINHNDNQAFIVQDAEIVYGALAVNSLPVGYIEVRNPIGQTVCHHGNNSFEISQSIRTGIKLFLYDGQNNNLIFRLHDADPTNELGSSFIHTRMRDITINMLRRIRREQTAQYTASGNRDVGIHCGHRNKQQQLAAAASGASNAQWLQSWHNYGLAVDIVFFNKNGQFAWCQTYQADNIHCSVEWDWNVISVHGIALGLTWGGNWTSPVDKPHYQILAANTPPNNLINLYTNTGGAETPGSEGVAPANVVQTKLNAVWNSLNV